MNSDYYPFDTSRPIDVICMGRVAVDFYAEQIGTPLEDAQSFRKYLGGCAANIAVGTAKLGLTSAMFSCIGNDDMGVFLKNVLIKEGVDTTLLHTTDKHLTALVILGVDPPDRFPLMFYRENCADMQIKEDHADADFFQKSKALLVTGTGLSTTPMYASTLHAVKMAKSTGTAVILDIDYRPVLWGLTKPGDGESRYAESHRVTEVLKTILPYVDLIVGTEEEVRILTGGSSLHNDLEIIREHTKALLVLKTGEKGCEVYRSDSSDPVMGTPYPIEVFNVLGAGDAFMSGFLRGWLKNESLETCAQFGNANGAIVVSRHGCAPAMASFEEMQYFIDHYQGADILVGREMKQLHTKTELGSARNQELLVLAFDHRKQFEDDVIHLAKDPQIIEQFKEHIFSGFLKVNAEYASEALAILVDPIYGKSILRQCQKDRIEFGLPVEHSGQFPISWIDGQNIYSQVLTGPPAGFVKVLWNYHIDMEQTSKQIQMAQLNDLYQACSALERRLMLELIIPKPFEHNGQAVVDAMEQVYKAGIYPYWWKIAAVDTPDEWSRITTTLDHFDTNAAIVILGGGDSMVRFEHWFQLVKSSNHCVGFAIGRTIFWNAWQQFSQGRLSASQVAKMVSSNYCQLIDLWREL